MKKKYIKITAIVVLILFLLICGPYLLTYKPSRLICVGQININHDAKPPFSYERGFDYIDKGDLEKELKWLSELESGYFVLNQQEIDEIVDAANQYKNYPTVILSRANSKVFWTRYRSPHIGYIDIHWVIGDSVNNYDDVLNVYVTKCTEIDKMPDDWYWNNNSWL